MNLADSYARREFLKNSLASIPVLMAGNAVFGKSGDLTSLSLQQASELVRTKSVSPVDLLRACLQRIEQLNPALNAFITVANEAALAQARELERERQRGRWRGPLHGIPLALKDNIDTAGIRTTAASAVFANRVPTEDAEVVRRLKAAGAVIIGKLNLHEFAHGLTSAISHFGPVHNPWQLEYMAGGSSGGCGAAVAAGLCYGAIGTDTGASVRYPAACCGIVGLKPTYGLVSARGVIPDSWSFDHVGPMCRTVTDTVMLLSGIAGYDPEDSGGIDAPRRDYAKLLPANTASLRLGHLMFEERLDAEVAAAMDEAIKVLRQLTAGVREVKLPPQPDLFASVADAEGYAFHAPYLEKTPELYYPVTRNDLQAGAKVKMAEYMQGRRELDRQRHTSGRLFADVDLLVTPTFRQMPLTLAACHEAFPDLGIHTGEFNIYGVPALSLPCGFTKAGLPIGLQIIGPRLGEAKVLALARAYEQATNWHKHKPAVS
ncbi:MAG: amidase [Acidobacteria bacterium]|nr:amidase [Acidobacteriota bacterium]